MLFDVPNCSAAMINNTEQLLKSIAWHLSAKRGCRGKVYTVIIDDDKVTFNIDIELQSHSSKVQKTPVIQHIFLYQFPLIMAYTQDINNTCNIKPGVLIPGKYEYRPFASGKYRRWFRIN